MSYERTQILAPVTLVNKIRFFGGAFRALKNTKYKIWAYTWWSAAPATMLRMKETRRVARRRTQVEIP